MSFGSGQGVKCYHSEHLYGELWHRGFTVSPDTPLCEYLVSFGANVEASGGVCGVKRHADARKRGMKRVQIEPHLSVTGACSAEWVPIKPKTDSAFLFAMIHVFLHELAREKLDLPFPQASHVLALSDRADRASSCAIRKRASRWCGTCNCPRGALRYARYRSGAGRRIYRRRDRSRPGRGDTRHIAVAVEPAFAHLVAHVKEHIRRNGRAHLRRAGRHDPPRRQ